MPRFTNYPNGISTSTLDADVLILNGSTVVGHTIVQSITISPGTIAASTTAEQSFAVASLGTIDTILSVTKPTAQAGIGIVGARVASAGTIGINFVNASTAAVVATPAQVYKIAILKGS